MWNRRRRAQPPSELEGMLRAVRPEASAEFVTGIADKIESSKVLRRSGWSRLAFAGAVSVFVLGTFASFGGIGYAASGAAHSYDAVKQIVVTHKVTVHTSAAADQYPGKPSKPKPAATPPTKKPGIQVAAKSSGKPPVASTTTSGTLPFTGISLLATFVLSLALIGVGVGLRRLERRR